jgi:DNA-binding NtrC family response regulator
LAEAGASGRCCPVCSKHLSAYKAHKSIFEVPETQKSEETMPARVVVVLDEQKLGEKVAGMLVEAGYETIALPDPMVALDALENAALIELLIASIDFPIGKPNGVSLALMARSRRPEMKVIFLGSPDYALYAAGLGDIIPTPATASEIAQHAERFLGSPVGASPDRKIARNSLFQTGGRITSTIA